MKSLKIAIIGSGISGLSCAWLLSKKHKVYLFEKNSYFGGHANTETVKVNSGLVDVDTGFIVFNKINYPNLCNFFNILNVRSYESEMSFAVSKNKGKFEYSGSNFDSIFSQRKNFFNFRFYFMLYEIIKFYKNATKDKEFYEKLSLGEYLEKKKYSDYFKFNHIYPMAASIWSASIEEITKYPFKEFVNFFSNHQLFNIFDRPKWRTVEGGSKNYVKKIIELKRINSKKNCIVKVLERNNNFVRLEVNKRKMNFDRLVMATHSDQVLKIINDLQDSEKKILKKIKYTKNEVFLHRDESLMPRLKKTWSSWNYIDESISNSNISVTYWMNRLQDLKTKTNIFVSLNPKRIPKKKDIFKLISYEHPQFNFETFKAQKEIKNIQGKHNTWFCGAYLGYGFHEDGIKSGLDIAEKISGYNRPWEK